MRIGIRPDCTRPYAPPSAGIFAYVVFGLKLRNIVLEWPSRAPRLIPVASFNGVSVFVMYSRVAFVAVRYGVRVPLNDWRGGRLSVALWPVWWILSPVILFVLFMGFLHALILSPV